MMKKTKLVKRLRKSRAISPIIAAILLIGITVVGMAAVAFVVLPLLSPGGNPVFIITLDSSYDYNNDGKIDAMLLDVNNIDTKAGYTANVNLEKWVVAPGYEINIDPSATESVLIITSSSSAQVSPNKQINIGLSANSEFKQLSPINTVGPQVPAPVVVTVVAGTERVTGVTVTFETGFGLPAAFPPTVTDKNGQVSAYLLPCYYRAKTSTGHNSDLFHNVINSSVTIETGAQVFEAINVRVLDVDGNPLPNVEVFDTDTSQYDLGQRGVTNTTGWTSFTEPEGSYLFRAEYASINYWSSTVNVPRSSDVTIRLSGGDLIGKVTFGGEPAGNGLLVRLYTWSNSSMGRYDYTNSTSYFEFLGVPSGLYRLRLDYQNNYYWSQVISTSDPNLIVDFGGGKLNVLVTAGGSPLPGGVLTRLFRGDTNTSAGRYDYLNSTGWAEYGMSPAGNYLLRVDWLNQYFYTGVFTHDGYPVTVDIGGGKLNVLVTAGGSPLPGGVLTRLFRGDTNTSAG
ncbi:MAG: carboxypeptidase-like regulatory domain-containing protein, partial [Candidatus Odinarchaeota archaeon]